MNRPKGRPKMEWLDDVGENLRRMKIGWKSGKILKILELAKTLI